MFCFPLPADFTDWTGDPFSRTGLRFIPLASPFRTVFVWEAQMGFSPLSKSLYILRYSGPPNDRISSAILSRKLWFYLLSGGALNGGLR